MIAILSVHIICLVQAMVVLFKFFVCVGNHYITMN